MVTSGNFFFRSRRIAQRMGLLVTISSRCFFFIDQYFLLLLHFLEQVPVDGFNHTLFFRRFEAPRPPWRFHPCPEVEALRGNSIWTSNSTGTLDSLLGSTNTGHFAAVYALRSRSSRLPSTSLFQNTIPLRARGRDGNTGVFSMIFFRYSIACSIKDGWPIFKQDSLISNAISFRSMVFVFCF